MNGLLLKMELPQKSNLELNKIYFFTATIHRWNMLLRSYENKLLISGFLNSLSCNGFIKIYGFVIMPNHIHLIWEHLKMNGKESAQTSFLKFTAHELLKRLKVSGMSHRYEVHRANKAHQIWKKNSLSIEIFSPRFARQKLDYIHFNPVCGKWNLSHDDLDYYFSSARFYETGIDDFGLLNNLYDVFDNAGRGSVVRGS